MENNKQERPAMAQNGLAGLLYGKDCPVGYKCLAMDCVKCLEMHADGKGKDHGNAQL